MKNLDWNKITYIVFFAIGVIIGIGLMSWLTMFLWNSILVVTFPSVPELSYLMSVGVYLILAMIFGKSWVFGEILWKKWSNLEIPFIIIPLCQNPILTIRVKRVKDVNKKWLIKRIYIKVIDISLCGYIQAMLFMR